MFLFLLIWLVICYFLVVSWINITSLESHTVLYWILISIGAALVMYSVMMGLAGTYELVFDFEVAILLIYI